MEQRWSELKDGEPNTTLPPIIASNIPTITRLANQSHILSPNNPVAILHSKFAADITNVGEKLQNGSDQINILDLILALYYSQHANQFTLNQAKHTLEDKHNLYAMEKGIATLWNIFTQDPSDVIKDFVASLAIHDVADKLSSPQTIKQNNTAINNSDNQNTLITKEESIDNIIEPIQTQDDLDDLDLMLTDAKVNTNNKSSANAEKKKRSRKSSTSTKKPKGEKTALKRGKKTALSKSNNPIDK